MKHVVRANGRTYESSISNLESESHWPADGGKPVGLFRLAGSPPEYAGPWLTLEQAVDAGYFVDKGPTPPTLRERLTQLLEEYDLKDHDDYWVVHLRTALEECRDA